MLTLTVDAQALTLLAAVLLGGGLLTLAGAGLALWADHDERMASRSRRAAMRPPGECDNPFCDRR